MSIAHAGGSDQGCNRRRGEHREQVAEANHAIAIDVRRAAAPIEGSHQDVGEPDHLVAIHVLGAVVGPTAIASRLPTPGVSWSSP